MGIENGVLEMLFIAPAERGKGLGARLLRHGMENYAVARLTVNGQNPQARGFYEHMGFRVYKRTDHDEQGNPYPLLYMELPGENRTKRPQCPFTQAATGPAVFVNSGNFAPTAPCGGRLLRFPFMGR